ncbi:MAG: hypothetical protein P1V97_39235, partial [Planctomycetota bacterium]|nr:hypothetical protein [Planctomycetota bacterium]
GARENATAITKAKEQKKDKDTIMILGFILDNKLRLLRHLPSKLRKFRSAPFDKFYRKQPDYENLRSKDIKTLKKWAASFDMNAKKLADTGPRSRYFDRVRLKILAETLIKDATKNDLEDEYAAEQYGGALWALYNSYYYGQEPRLKKPVREPSTFQQLGVRPGVYKPEGLFDEEDSFHVKTWQSRLRPLKGLFESSPQRR